MVPLVRSHFEFASVVWNNDQLRSLAVIEGVQRRLFDWLKYEFDDVLRGVGRDDTSRTLNLPLLSRRTCFDFILFYKNLRG